MVEYEVYLKYGNSPTICTHIYCNNCKHTINAGPNYKPKFCDMCGAPIVDNLDAVEWKEEDVAFVDYINYLLDTQPDWIIRKVRYERTEWGRIGLPPDTDHIPVMIGKDMDDILEFVNKHGTIQYIEDDFEPATEAELVAYAKSCGKFWRG